MDFLSIELWVAFQMLIDLVLVVLILYLLSNLKSGIKRDVSKEAYENVVGLIEPLLKEAETSSNAFERQLKDKNRIINDLNEKLDRRIISLNLLLSRAEKYHSSFIKELSRTKTHANGRKETILKMYEFGETTDAISKKLSMPKGEVELVVDLKKSFQKTVEN